MRVVHEDRYLFSSEVCRAGSIGYRKCSNIFALCHAEPRSLSAEHLDLGSVQPTGLELIVFVILKV